MAGVYIKGMEMPKACCFCELYELDLYWCRAMKKDIDVDKYESVSSSCPLIPVHDHGDLIDRDAFVAEMRERQDAAYKWLREAKDHDVAVRADATISFMSEVKLTLDKAPTVIPADKEGEV